MSHVPLCGMGLNRVEYKAIKVPKETYNMIETTRQQLANKGIQTLPQELREIKNCPICGNKLEKFGVKYEYLRCQNPDCGYNQKNLEVNTTGTFAMGAMVGLGLAAIIYLLTRDGGD